MSVCVQSVAIQPKNAQAWNQLGLCQISSGDLVEGIVSYKKALKLNPHHKETWLNLGQAHKEVSLA